MSHHRPPPGRVPDYTGAFLVSGGVVVFIVLFVIWAIWGLLAALATGWAGNRLIGHRRTPG